MNPLFIFSLPRSGSTLLQRMLAGHSEISSIADSGFLLPLVYMYREEGTLAEYSHVNCQEALDDLVNNTQGGMATHRQAIRDCFATIFEGIAQDGSTYFLDKTPRYYLIIDEIAEIYSDAKFIFLFRNPLSIYASVINTWNHETFKPTLKSALDLRRGPELLAQGLKKLRDRSLVVRYEELVREPKEQLERIADFLGLNFEDSMLSSFRSQNAVDRDDPTVRSYKSVSTESLDEWKSVITNRFRKKILKKYLAAIPAEILAVQGYDKKALLSEVKKLAGRGFMLRDIYYYFSSQMILATKANIFFLSQKGWTRNKFMS